MNSNAYAMIMAGGAGTRLWPLSREGRPKPLLPLTEDRSMFQIAVERLLPLFPPERILVVANPDLSAQLHAQAPNLPAENFIVEPLGRDTAPAVGLGAIHVRQRDPDAVMAVLTADHHIADEQAFRKVLGIACTVASEGRVVTLGIHPTGPSTGFGYIERGRLDRVIEGVEIFELNRFIEKPQAERARELVADERYSWNSGMFIWPVHRVMAEFEQHAADIHADLERIAAAIGGARYNQVLDQVWPGIRRISVDFALMEHIHEGISVIPVEMGWSDIGNFGTLYDILSEGAENDNVAHVPREPVLLDSHGNMLISGRLVAAIGIDDLVVIDTEDVLLLCRRDRVQDVKKVVDELKKGHRNEYL